MTDAFVCRLRGKNLKNYDEKDIIKESQVLCKLMVEDWESFCDMVSEIVLERWKAREKKREEVCLFSVCAP